MNGRKQVDLCGSGMIATINEPWLRTKHASASAIKRNPSSRLFEALVEAAAPKHQAKGKTATKASAVEGATNNLLIPIFHPHSVTRIAAKSGFMRDSSFHGELVPLTLAFFEPAWCQPRNDPTYPVPTIQDIHRELDRGGGALRAMAATEGQRIGIEQSGAFGLHYHRAANSGDAVEVADSGSGKKKKKKPKRKSSGV